MKVLKKAAAYLLIVTMLFSVFPAEVLAADENDKEYRICFFTPMTPNTAEELRF